MHDEQERRRPDLRPARVGDAARPDVRTQAALDDADHAVLRRLRRVAELVDPMPAGLVARARFAVALDEVYAEVARIQRAPVGATAGVRGPGAATTSSMTFTADDLTVVVSVAEEGRDRLRIDGWVAPGGAFEVGLRLQGETRRTAVAAGGRFEFSGVPRGLVQLLVEPRAGHEGPVVVTPAVEL